MPGKKAHVKKNIENAGMHGAHQPIAGARKSTGRNDGEFMRDMKQRAGQFTAAGAPPLIKK